MRRSDNSELINLTIVQSMRGSRLKIFTVLEKLSKIHVKINSHNKHGYFLVIFHFISLFFRHQWTAHQASCLATIIFRLVDVFPMKIIIGVDKNILNRLFEAMVYLTCSFLEKSAVSPKVSVISSIIIISFL